MYIDTHVHCLYVQIQKTQTRLYMHIHTSICMHKRTFTLINTHTIHITHKTQARKHAYTNIHTLTHSKVYRPPSCDMASTLSFLTALETVFAPLKADFPVLVMGDFNLTKIDWNAKCTIVNHTNADRQLLLTSQRTRLLQQVSSPTHHTNLTDLVFISKYNVITNTLFDMPFSTSDHSTFSFDLSTTVRLLSSSIQPKTRSTLDFSKIDYIGLASDLLTTNWRSHFSLSDHIDVAWDNFSTYFMPLVIKYTPTKRIHCTHRVAFLPANIMRLIILKQSAWGNIKKHKSISNKRIVYRLAKTVRNSIFAYRKAQEENILLSGSITKFYSYARSCMVPLTSIGPIKDTNGLLVENDVDKAELFNNFFLSVYVSDDDNAPPFDNRTNVIKPSPTFTRADVKKALS